MTTATNNNNNNSAPITTTDNKISVGGYLTWWKNQRTHLADFRAKLCAAGFGCESPEAVTPKRLLRQTVARVYGATAKRGATVTVRPMAGNSGFYVTKETDNRTKLVGDDTDTLVARVHLNGSSGTIVKVEDNDSDRAQRLRDEYNKARAFVGPDAVHRSVVRIICNHLGGTMVREGVYFFPVAAEQQFRQVISAVTSADTDNSVDNQIHVIGFDCTDPDSVSAVASGLRDSIETELQQLRQQLASADTSARAADTKRQRAIELRDKIKQYESILGGSLLPELQAQCSQVEQQAVKATFRANSADDADKQTDSDIFV